jgi:heme A synthase
LALVIVQGILGGITVLFYLPPLISVAHATMAQIFFATVTSLTLFTSRWWHTADSVRTAAREARPVKLSFATVIATLIQLILGATYRHGLTGIIPHLLGAGAVLFLASWAARAVKQAFPSISLIQNLRVLLSSLIGVQILLGFGSWWAVVRNREALQPLPEMVWFTVAHLATGALTLAVATLLWLTTSRVSAVAQERNAVLNTETLPPALNQEVGR